MDDDDRDLDEPTERVVRNPGNPGQTADEPEDAEEIIVDDLDELDLKDDDLKDSQGEGPDA